MNKLTPGQKLLAWALIGALGFGFVKLFNYVIPDITMLMHNMVLLSWETFKLAAMTGLGMFLFFNWTKIVALSEIISWKSTCWMIKQDPLSVMDRYARILRDKLVNLRKTLVNLKGEKVNLQRQIELDEKTVKEQIKLGIAYKQENNMPKASLAGTRAKNAQDSINLYQPNLQRMTRSIDFMEKLSENWDISITSMEELTERKRVEWRTLKSNAKALKQSEAFLNGDTEEGRMYKESIKSLEEQVSQKIAYIDDFELRAKPIMEDAAASKRMNESEGLDMLKEWEEKLLMPDFAESIPFTEVKNKEFNLLNK